MAIDLTRISELALLTFDREAVLNVLNFRLLGDFGAALDQVAGGDARAAGNWCRRQTLLRRRGQQGADGQFNAGAA